MLRLIFLLFLSCTCISSISEPVDLTNKINKHSDHDWRTVEYKRAPSFPQSFILDFKTVKETYGFVYIPNPYQSPGRIRKYNLLLSLDGKHWDTIVKNAQFSTPNKASFWPSSQEQFDTIIFKKSHKARFLKLEALSEVENRPLISAAEIHAIFNKKNYPFKGKTFAELKGTRLAPSIHASYFVDKNCHAFYNEMEILKSTKGSYFMSCGFDAGYFGMQELKNGKKIILFSVWDSYQVNDPNLVPKDKQVKIIYKDPAVRSKRFGHEGTGRQSFFDYDWKVNQKYRFMVSIKNAGKRNEYTAHFFIPEKNVWVKLITLSTLSSRRGLSGFHSFVEDFRRDFKSFTQTRTAKFSNTLFKNSTNQWQTVHGMRFTKDSNPQMNINCTIQENKATLSTGGEIRNNGLKVFSVHRYSETGSSIPEDIKSFK